MTNHQKEQTDMDDSKVLEKDNGELKPTRSQLLERYLNNTVTEFKQYDCFTDVGPDIMFQPDKDGDYLFGVHTTHELMHGTSVRVLIRPDESKKDVVRVLLKIAEQINCSDDFKNVIDDEDCPFF